MPPCASRCLAFDPSSFAALRILVPGLDLPDEVPSRRPDDRKIEVEEGLTVNAAIRSMDGGRHLNQSG